MSVAGSVCVASGGCRTRGTRDEEREGHRCPGIFLRAFLVLDQRAAGSTLPVCPVFSKHAPPSRGGTLVAKWVPPQWCNAHLPTLPAAHCGHRSWPHASPPPRQCRLQQQRSLPGSGICRVLAITCGMLWGGSVQHVVHLGCQQLTNTASSRPAMQQPPAVRSQVKQQPAERPGKMVPDYPSAAPGFTLTTGRHIDRSINKYKIAITSTPGTRSTWRGVVATRPYSRRSGA